MVECARGLRSLADEIEGAPQTWTRGVMARDGRGREVPYFVPRAEKWCLVGFLFRDRLAKAAPAVSRAAGQPLSIFNDEGERTAADIVAVLRRAADSYPAPKEVSWEEK